MSGLTTRNTTRPDSVPDECWSTTHDVEPIGNASVVVNMRRWYNVARRSCNPPHNERMKLFILGKTVAQVFLRVKHFVLFFWNQPEVDAVGLPFRVHAGYSITVYFNGQGTVVHEDELIQDDVFPVCVRPG